MTEKRVLLHLRSYLLSLKHLFLSSINLKCWQKFKNWFPAVIKIANDHSKVRAMMLHETNFWFLTSNDFRTKIRKKQMIFTFENGRYRAKILGLFFPKFISKSFVTCNVFLRGRCTSWIFSEGISLRQLLLRRQFFENHCKTILDLLPHESVRPSKYDERHFQQASCSILDISF